MATVRVAAVNRMRYRGVFINAQGVDAHLGALSGVIAFLASLVWPACESCGQSTDCDGATDTLCGECAGFLGAAQDSDVQALLDNATWLRDATCVCCGDVAPMALDHDRVCRACVTLPAPRMVPRTVDAPTRRMGGTPRTQASESPAATLHCAALQCERPGCSMRVDAQWSADEGGLVCAVCRCHDAVLADTMHPMNRTVPRTFKGTIAPRTTISATTLVDVSKLPLPRARRQWLTPGRVAAALVLSSTAAAFMALVGVG